MTQTNQNAALLCAACGINLDSDDECRGNGKCSLPGYTTPTPQDEDAQSVASERDAIPELRNIESTRLQGDFAGLVQFMSCRSANAFKIAIDSAIAAIEKEKP